MSTMSGFHYLGERSFDDVMADLGSTLWPWLAKQEANDQESHMQRAKTWADKYNAQVCPKAKGLQTWRELPPAEKRAIIEANKQKKIAKQE